MTVMTQTVCVQGMHCPNCETVVERALKSLHGVRKVQADYGTETVVVTYDKARTDLFHIFQALETKGYECTLMHRRHPLRDGIRKFLRVILGLLGMIAIFYVGSRLSAVSTLPGVGQQASAGLLLVAGLLTGFHCVGMCGGFIVVATRPTAPAVESTPMLGPISLMAWAKRCRIPYWVGSAVWQDR